MPIDIATGDVELAREDFALPGRVPLKWTRHFKTALLTSTAPLAPGWTVSLFPSLKRVGTDWHFTTGEGDLHVFPDPDGRVVKGHTIRLLGAFHEMERRENRLVITQWDVDSGEIHRVVFATERLRGILDLVGIEDVSGDGLELTWDTSGRMTRLHQRIEKRTVVVNYSTVGRIDSLALVTDGVGQTQLVNYEYDEAGRLSAAYDRRGLANRYEYDAQSRITRELIKDGAVYSYKYDEKGRCVRFSGIDRYNEKRLRFLDPARTTIVTDSYGKSSIYKHLPDGQIASETDPSGNMESTVFDEYSRIVTKVDPSGASTCYTYDGMGNRESITDPLGNTYWFAFNAHHQPISVTNPLGKTWYREYDATGRLVAVTNPLGASWKIGYDEFGNPSFVLDPMGSTRRLSYADGLVRQMTDWMGHVTRLAWDEFGRVIERIGPIGERTAFTYDLAGNPVEVELPNRERLRATYDSGDNLTSFTNAKGHTTHFRYGTCSRLLERVDPMSRVVRYSWGTEPERLDRIMNEKQETFTYFRDDRGRIVRERSFDGREQRFDYDPDGRTIAFTNGNGERIRLKRDSAGKLVQQTLPDGTVTSYEYDAVGRMLAAVNPDIPVRFDYDDAGRLVREIQGKEWVRTEYDSVGGVISTKTSLGHEVHYELDRNGRMRNLSTRDKHTIAFERDARGRETGRQMPGGLRLEQSFDNMGRLLEQRVGNALSYTWLDPGSPLRHHVRTGDEIIKRDYRYDADGLLLSSRDGRWGTIEYCYDPADRVLSALRDCGINENFGYDLADNRTYTRQRSLETSTDHLCTYAVGNRLLQCGDTHYDYDGDGRLVRKTETSTNSMPQIWNYYWDGHGQLRKLCRPDGQEWVYKYDAFGRRMAKRGPTSACEFLWDSDNIIQEIPERGHAVAWITKCNSFSPLAKVQDGLIYSIIADQLGTPREMLDAVGKVIWAASFSAWGQTIGQYISQANADCSIRFQGHWFDSESNLHYCRFRYYDPSNGRFISPDPIRIAGGTNLYRYVENPIALIDPLGLADEHDIGTYGSLTGKPNSGDGMEAHEFIRNENLQQQGLTPTPGRRDPANPSIALTPNQHDDVHSHEAAARKAMGLAPGQFADIKTELKIMKNALIAAGVPKDKVAELEKAAREHAKEKGCK